MKKENILVDIDCPPILFRFRSCSTEYFEEELERAVLKQEQYFASIDIQNDPFDCNPNVIENSDKDILDFYRSIRKRHIVSVETLTEYYPKLTSKELKALQKKQFSLSYANMKKARQSTKELMDFFRTQSKIICLTERWDSPLHWAHYASGHNGIAFGFKTNVNLAMYRDDDIPLSMIYSDKRPEVSEIDILCWLENPKGSKHSKHDLRGRRAFDAFTTSKSNEWSYEKEWRVQKRFEGSGKYCFVPALELNEIIVGARVSEANKKLIESICKGKCEVQYAKLNETEYRLELSKR